MLCFKILKNINYIKDKQMLEQNSITNYLQEWKMLVMDFCFGICYFLSYLLVFILFVIIYVICYYLYFIYSIKISRLKK